MRHVSFCRSYRCRGTSRPLRCESLEERRLLTITVGTLIDESDGSIVDGDVSLRDAIAIAPAGETIDFDASLDGGSILLTMHELSITKAMTIDASSLGNGLTIRGLPIDNLMETGSHIFNIDDGDDATDSSVRIRGLTLTSAQGAIRTTEGLTVTSSTISRNATGGRGGGIWASGDLTVTSSTISGNVALGGGGGIWASGDLTLTSSTISENGTWSTNWGDGGGIWSSGEMTVTIDSSIVACNSDSGTAPDIRPGTGELAMRYSLIGDSQGTSLAEAPVGMPDANGNLIGGSSHGVIDPLLDPLANNGGPTQTHALLSGSPAIDTGDPGDFARRVRLHSGRGGRSSSCSHRCREARRASAARATASRRSGGRVGRPRSSGGRIWPAESVPLKWPILTNPCRTRSHPTHSCHGNQ